MCALVSVLRNSQGAPEVAHVILFGFLTGANMGARNIGEMQNGRHPVEMSIAV